MNIDKLKRLVAIVVIFLVNSGAYSQSSRVGRLTHLLNSGRYFEVKKLYNEICDSIPLKIDSYYKFRMAEAENKREAAVVEMERTLKRYPGLFGSETIDIYSILFNTYRNLEKYNKVIEIYKLAKKHLRKNPYNIDKEELVLRKKNLKESFNYFKEVSNQPSIKMKRNTTPTSINIEDCIMLGFEAKLNGVSKRVIFDTGNSSYIIMKKKTAKDVGIRLKEDTKGMLNGVEMMGQKNIIDSIEIGNITLYNIPVIIYDFDLASCLPDSIRNDSSMMKRFEIGNEYFENPIIGLPSMLLIGKMKINWEDKKISFPHEDIRLGQKDNNLYLYNNALYTYLKINRIPFTGLLDSGSSGYVELDTIFYQKNQKGLPIDNVKGKKKLNVMSVHGAKIAVPYLTADNPIVTFNEKTIAHCRNKHDIIIYPIFSTRQIFDGLIGLNFLKCIGKRVLLDLDNMRLEALE